MRFKPLMVFVVTGYDFLFCFECARDLAGDDVATAPQPRVWFKLLGAMAHKKN